jgi:aminoglycoside phosphotransferase (APT) family kinase protein
MTAPDKDQQQLQRWLRTTLGSEATITAYDAGAPGFSNETVLFSATWETGGVSASRDLVLRKPRTTVKFFPDYDIEFQYRMLQALQANGLPTPAPVWFEADPVHLGVPFYVMDRIPGTVPNDGPPAGIHGGGYYFDATEAERSELWCNSLDALATLHQTDLHTLSLPFPSIPRTVREAVDTQLATIESWLRWGTSEPIPAIDTALDIVRRSTPQDSDIVLCWGDAKPGNLVYRDHAVVGVLDWEMSFLGCPEMDVMYWIITDEVSAATFNVPRLPGCPGRQETLRYYEATSGRTLVDLEFHELLQTLRLAVLLVLADHVVTEMGIAQYFPDNWSTNNPPYHKLLELAATAFAERA